MRADRSHPAAPAGGLVAVALRELPIFVVVGLVALAAWWSFPSWDDALFWLAWQESGAGSLVAMVPDRPVLGRILAWLAAQGTVIPGGIAYVITWLGTALVTRSYWTELFPAWRRYGTAVALLSVAPVLIETQTVAVNPVFGAQLGSILVYAVVLIVHRAERHRVAATTGAAVAILAAVSVSEYAVLATLVAASVLALAPESVDGAPRWHVRWRPHLVLCAVAIVGYLAFRLTGDPNARPEVNPEHQIATNGLGKLVGAVVRAPLSLWHAVLGELFKDLGEINVSRATAAGLPAGALVAVLAALGLRRFAPVETAGDDLRRLAWRGARIAVPFTAGLGLITFMTSTIRANFETRLWMPLLPLGSCLTAWALLLLLRRQLWSAAFVTVAFLSGYLAANAAAGAHTNRSQLSRLGNELHGRLAPDGLTVALFVNQPTNHAVGDPIARPYELIAALTRGWPLADRRRFWAGAYEWQPLSSSLPGMEGVCGPVASLESDARGWSRRGPVARTVWVSFDPDGAFHVVDLVPQVTNR